MQRDIHPADENIQFGDEKFQITHSERIGGSSS